jgi:LemA protein
MMPILITIFVSIIVIGLIAYLISIFNNLKLLKVNIQKSVSNLDVLFKQRFDEIPQLINVCKSYMKYEAETLRDLVELSKRYEESRKNSLKDKNIKSSEDLMETNTLDNELTSKVEGLASQISLTYPELKALPQFQNIQYRISQLEDQISDRREFINESVAMYNTHLESFPDMIVARVIGLKQEKMFSVENHLKEIPDTNISI